METLSQLRPDQRTDGGALAVAAATIARFTRRPALWYTLWLVVLLRLLAPPLFDRRSADPGLRPHAWGNRRRGRRGERRRGCGGGFGLLPGPASRHCTRLGGRSSDGDRVRHLPIRAAAPDPCCEWTGIARDREPGGGPCTTVGPAPRPADGPGPGPGPPYALGLPRFGPTDSPVATSSRDSTRTDRHPARPRARPPQPARSLGSPPRTRGPGGLLVEPDRVVGHQPCSARPGAVLRPTRRRAPAGAPPRLRRLSCRDRPLSVGPTNSPRIAGPSYGRSESDER